MVRGVALSFAAVVLGAGVRGAQQAPAFRAATDAVIVNVSVRDGLKVPQDLGPSDFQVLDDGVLQEVTDVSYGKVPVDVTVALDVSASETGAPLARLKKGVLELVSDLTPEERLKLVAFNQRTRAVVDFTSDHAAVTQAVASLVAGGGTSIFDALAASMLAPADPGRRQLVTIFTDGDDGLSTTEPAELIETGRRSSATVTLVIPRTSVSSRPLNGPGGREMAVPMVAPPPRRPESALLQDVRLMNDLATLTGGRVIMDPGPPIDLGSSFRAALSAFRTSYVLYFTPRGVARAGFHTLAVTLPKHSKFTVTARSGYFGG